MIETYRVEIPDYFSNRTRFTPKPEFKNAYVEMRLGRELNGKMFLTISISTETAAAMHEAKGGPYKVGDKELKFRFELKGRNELLVHMKYGW